MECVDYDNAFQLELCDKFPLWVPPPTRKRTSQGPRKSPAKKFKATSHAGRKRKRKESLDSDVELNFSAEAIEPKINYFSEHSEDDDDIQQLT